MKNKKALKTALTIVCIVASAVLLVIFIQGEKKQPEPEVPETSTSQIVTTTKPTTEQTTTETTTESTTKNVAASLPEFAKGKYWYLYNGEELNCYAFKLNTNGKVDAAFFGKETIEGEDPQYSKGKGNYRIEGKKIKIYDLPDNFPAKEFEFEIKDKKLTCGEDELKSHKELSLNNALSYFV